MNTKIKHTVPYGIKPDRCQFAEGKENHCLKKPEVVLGGFWFCKEHGARK